METLKMDDRVTLLQVFQASSSSNNFDGKFLLCRTISAPTFGPGGSILLSITDPEASNRNGRTTQLSVKYFSNVTALKRAMGNQLLKDVIPIGMYLAVLQPQPSSKKIECDNPSQIRLLSEKKVMEIMGQGFKWSLLNVQDRPRSFWEDGVAGSTLWERLWTFGNNHFMSGCTSDAVRFFDLALDYASSAEEVSITLSNKALALLKLDCPNAALCTARDAVTAHLLNSEAYFRIGMALVALGRFEDAVAELEVKLPMLPDQEVRGMLEELLEKAKKTKPGPPSPKVLISHELSLIAMLKGGHDPNKPSAYKTFSNSEMKEVQEIPDYVGPVEVRARGKDEGGGHGLFATEDISPGQVILVGRPMAYHVCSNFLGHTSCRTEMLTSIANSVHFDPIIRPSLYQLWAGEELGCLTYASTVGVDMARIAGILDINPFARQRPGLDNDWGGLWILPSFINHSCSQNNVQRHVEMNKCFIKALNPIQAGEELLMSYVNSLWGLREREEFLRGSFDFRCTCSLCNWERKEKKSPVGRRRAKLVKLFNASVAANHGEDLDFEFWTPYNLKEVLSDIEFLEGLWKETTIPYLFDINGLKTLILHLAILGTMGPSPNLKRNEDALRVAHLALAMGRHGVQKMGALGDIHEVLVRLHSPKEDIIDNLKELKKEIVSWYGSAEGIHIMHEPMLQGLKGMGIDFFSI